MVTFYIIRHGNTELNKKGILQGGLIDSPLTDQGFNDALLMAKKLKKFKIDAIFSSDLGRAFITAHIISDKLELVNKIFRLKEFREVHFGDLAGMFKDEVKLKYPKYKKDSNFVFPNGESYLDTKRRVVKKLLELSGSSYKNILIVTHAGCIRGIISWALNKDFDSILEKKISHAFVGKLEIKNNKVINFKIINE